MKNVQLTMALSHDRVRSGLNYCIEYCILAMAFFLPLSMNVSSLFLSGGATLWLAKMLWSRQVQFRRTPFDRVIAALVI
ncbi:MAG TPA: hypothetical protein VN611_09985, partial [Patescibacteria group bacterium]|nr:hypothetical protein [Patescibacteria group bacterium]